MTRQRAEKLSEKQQASIIESDRLGHKPSVIASVLKKSVSQIKTFYSRWKLNSTLPPKDIVRNTIFGGRMGTRLKAILAEFPKLSSRKLARKLKDDVPNQEA